MERMLPNVYQELHECLFNGMRLVVKNTFVDIDDSLCVTQGPKTRSLPTLPTLQRLLEEGEGKEHLAAARTPLHKEKDSLEEMSTTTFMIRSLPLHMTRAKLEQLLDAAGFAMQYDFIYLPANLKVKECYGYGFVNLINAAVATRFVKYFDGYSWPEKGQEPMAVHESKALEGLDMLIQRYRNSPLMHESVPDEVRPAIYHNGVKVPFPAPTVNLRAPRMRSVPGQKEQKYI